MANIQNLEEGWNDHSGKEVREFLQNKLRELNNAIPGKIGSVHISSNAENNANVVIGFRSEDDYDAWRSLSVEDRWGEIGQAMMLSQEILPTLGADTRTVRLVLEATPALTQPNTDVTIGVKGISIITYGNGSSDDVAENLLLQVQTRTSQNGTWVSRNSVNIQSNQTSFTPVDLNQYLLSGYNQIRVRVVGDDNGSPVTSIWTTLTMNVVSLSLISATPVAAPFTGNELELKYYIGGSADKILRLQFGHYSNSSFVIDYSYETDAACIVPIGQEVFASVARVITLTPTALSLTNILTEGIHVVRAMLYVSDDVKTDWVETEYMSVPNGESSNTIVVINDIASGIENYSNVSFFKWSASRNGQIVFRLTNAGDTVEYARWESAAVAGTEQILVTQLGITSQLSEIAAYMRIEDLEGNELHNPVYFEIENNQDFAPVSNPVFVLQPSTRSNSEANPCTIINAVTGQVVASEGWGTLDMVNDGYKDGALVVNAGSELRIDFNALATLQNDAGVENGLTEKSVTIEVDLENTNITDEEAPVIKLGTYMNTANDHDIYGLEIRPTEVALMTKNKRVREDQNAKWAEDRRTRITVNIVYGLNPDNDPTGVRLNYARVFINDTIEREFNYNANDSFIKDSDAKLVIGSAGADTRIFDMRVYTKALSTSDVQRDYRAGLSTTQAKLEWMQRNDILGQSGAIDFEKAKNAGYNVIGHTGHLPKYGDENSGETKGQVSLFVHIHDDAEHSGTYTSLDNKGQGTTAMTYWDWNQQYKTTASTEFIDSNGVVHSNVAGFYFGGIIIPFPKGVGKINFASSMQGHKMGLTRAYDELFKQMVADGYLSEPGQFGIWRNAGNVGEPRLTVYEKPFLFFHRETENDPWEFRYLMTFGSGKGDKPTFGFDKTTTPHMMMVEGADNDRQLALFACPWDDDVTYNAEKEAWYIGNVKQINFGFGKTSKVDGEDVPADSDALTAMKNFFNFIYLHTRNIQCYDATESHLKASSPYAMTENGYGQPSTNVLYWVSQADAVTGSQKYDLFRYDTLRSEWRPAGINGATLNMRTQYESFANELSYSTETWTGLASDAITASAKTIRTAHFAANAETYIHVDDGLFHQAFDLFFAGTDNRAKNTYYYVDPVTLKIRWMQDDLDTVLPTNNIGQNRKPYYVEIHDKNQYGEYYWQGENSGLYNLLEEAFSDRLTVTMRHMMESMAKLEGSAIDYLVSRVLQAQDYFPATAYNEMARLVYERASIAQSTGEYVNNSAQAITQSNGTQRWSEYQWLVDRVMYISSWCEFGEFASGTNAAGALTWRGQTGTYAFTLTPAKWLYPRVVHGSSTKEASNVAYRVRVPKGQSFAYKAFQNDGDTTISIRGIDYYSEIGDMNIPLSASQQTTFDFAGKRLRKVHVNVDGINNNLFVTQRITVSAINIVEFIVRGINTLTGELDLRQCTRLQTIDLRGDTITSVRLPQTSALSTLYLPESLNQLQLQNLSNLSVFSIAGVSYLQSVIINNTPVDILGLVNTIYNAYVGGQSVSLNTISLIGLNITLQSGELDFLLWLANLKYNNPNSVVINGRIDYNGQLTTDQKFELMRSFGEVDDENNDLYITYLYTINSGIVIQIFCDGVADRITETGTYQFRYLPMNNGSFDQYASYIKRVEWSLSNSNYATIDNNGLLTVNSIGENENAKVTLTCTVTLLNDDVLTDELELIMHNREADLGDYIYCDGTFSKKVISSKTIVGMLFINENGIKELITLRNLKSDQWGLFSNNVSGVTVPSGESAYDTPLSNYGNTNNFTAKDTNTNYWNEANINDNNGFVSRPGTAEGDMFYKSNVEHDYDTEGSGVAHFEEGKYYPLGYRNTIMIMRLRNRILNGSTPALGVPAASAGTTEKESLDSLIASIIAANNNNNNYREYYYPAFSYCFAYEPTVKEYETLHNKFKAHKWFLPSSGELARAIFYWLRNADASVLSPFKEAKAAGLMAFSGDWYWSSTECNASNAWGVNGGSGVVLVSYYKLYSYIVRPVCAF